MLDVRRRQFFTLLGDAAAAWPLAAYAQQGERVRRIGALMLPAADDPEGKARAAAFEQSLGKLGWTVGHNLRIDYRWGMNDVERARAAAAELLRLAPDVILANGTPALPAVKQTTLTVPIVFTVVNEPVAMGYVASLSHPGGNVTGLTNFSEILASKQIDLLRDLMPRLSRLGILVSTSNPLHAPQLRDIEQATKEAGLLLRPFEVPRPEALDGAFAAMARERLDALLVPPDIIFFSYRSRIAELSATIRLPAIYGYREHVEDGGLISYGPDVRENYRRAPIFVDKILKGARPADLPIERVTIIELLINLKTAKALGLDVPPTLLARADEVIE
jgi:putative tryptophan/tyrosine transport system substrate-binding protein